MQVCKIGEEKIVAQNSFTIGKSVQNNPYTVYSDALVSQRELKILMCRFCQLGGLTLVQVCKVGEEKIVAQKFFHHRKERPK